MRGRPRPRFSAPSFSCLEARGWLDFELDSLIFPRQQSRRGATAGLLGGRESVLDETSCVSHLQTLITPAQQETAFSQGPPGLPPWPRVVCPARRAVQAAGWGWAVGPNQGLISCSEGLFVALPPPLKSAASPDLAVGEAVPAEVWARWSSGCQAPPSTVLPLLF